MTENLKPKTQNSIPPLGARGLLIIFTRNPELGKVKTRLAKTVGDEAALDIYKFLLQHTVKVTESLPFDKAVYYSVKVRDNDLWDASIFQKHAQHGDDLGQRMQHAFNAAFESGYEKAVIIGSDLQELQPKHLEQAFAALDEHDVVMGPAEDGGYYLLGMKILQPNIFQNKAWGTETVRRDTLQDLQEVSVHLLEELNDVDYYEDIKDNPVFQPFIKHINP